jgi:hypothetical protein
MADTADIMANILARYRREADTSSVEAGRNSVAAHREHIEIGVPANGVAVNGIGILLRAGAFLTRLTTAIILMGITLRMRTDLVIPTTGVGTHLGAGAILTRTCPTAIILTGTILRIGTLMTTAQYQEGDCFDPDPSVILFRRITTP